MKFEETRIVNIYSLLTFSGFETRHHACNAKKEIRTPTIRDISP